ncbi:hypothetical protein ET475_09100 [Microbacterium protaetiae]|uniref:Mannosylglycerate hydrolase MGH1-like glycoside hydrolase domain-containing protein n=1 Tax=Microbacterium protaetiae TaxID=2509458 RepID=A0A4V0YDB5_9MICO|nr:hypothetical protein [Microbacterium protaetiae]QAY60131.1 hypothetical protein ET475_09100 [Microbacterium protaetiae]
MTARDEALRRLRGIHHPHTPVARALAQQGVAFAAVGGPLHERWQTAVAELEQCVWRVDAAPPAVLSEGGVYAGSWLESTGTISAEVLTRFAPALARETLVQFARHQRADGLLPYKVTADGPAFTQIQTVTPLARSVWNHYLLTGRDEAFLGEMSAAMSRNDAWLAAHRDTRGAGAVEAFCTFDTGHDLSPRFWFVPDRCYHGDAARYDPAAPLLPYIAPDLTANVACQRRYLAHIARESGEPGELWEQRADAAEAALWRECHDEPTGLFFDRDGAGGQVRIASDVLLRVLACEIGDDAFFTAALERHLMNTRAFLSHYGFTSLAMDDPRFDHDFRRNSWGGPVNMLTMIRAPHAFEHHGRVAELALATQPVLAALAVADRFAQCLDPWSGEAGFTEAYSPALLFFLDAIERSCGILPRPDGAVWFTGLAPTRLAHGAAEASAYARSIDDAHWELAADDESVQVLRAGAEVLRFPRGWRVETDRVGTVRGVVCVDAAPVAGALITPDGEVALTLEPNERVAIEGARPGTRTRIGFVPPQF